MNESDARRGQRKAAVLQKESFRGLTQHLGWENLKGILEAQISARIGRVLFQVLADQNSVFAQEYMKGEIAALKLVLELPGQQISEAEAVLSKLGLEDDDG
jgi:hypothetical protein